MATTVIFWLVCSALIAAAVACLLWPLLRPTRSDSLSAASVNGSILRDQFGDLERDTRVGLLRLADVQDAHDELQRRTLTDMQEDRSMPRAMARWLGPALVLTALPPLAVVSYLSLGSPAAIEPAALMANAEQDDFMSRLQRHLRDQPRDGRGWVLLARGYAQRQQFIEAVAAYERAVTASAKVAGDASVLCEYADVLAMTQGGVLTGKPAELVRHALTLDPRHRVALEMAGSAAYERRRYQAAVEHWTELLAQLPAHDESHRQLASAIDRARRKAAVSLPDS
jgi:cytochrome c-type biogenesis protein CcmH